MIYTEFGFFTYIVKFLIKYNMVVFPQINFLESPLHILEIPAFLFETAGFINKFVLTSLYY